MALLHYQNGDQVKAAAYNAIRSLPQSPHIDDASINLWIDTISSFEPERLNWHIRRLSGIGGSEIGTVVSPFANIYAPHNQPRDVFFDKMMRTLPTRPNGHMRRGIEMEEKIRAEFRKQYGLVPNDAVMNAIAKHRDPNHIWRVGNVDDFGSLNRFNWMVDYKCPMPGFVQTYNDSGIDFNYIAQLHHYKAIADQVGARVDGLLLVSWDMENWCLDVRAIPFDSVLAKLMEEAGDWLWNDCVLKNRMPESTFEKAIDIAGEDEVAAKLRNLFDRLSTTSLLANVTTGERDTIKSEIVRVLRTKPVLAGKVAHNLMTATAKEVLNLDFLKEKMGAHGLQEGDYQKRTSVNINKLIELAEQHNLDFSDCYETTLDTDKAIEALMARGMDDSQFHTHDFTLALSRKKSGDEFERISLIKEVAMEAVGHFHTDNERVVDMGQEMPRVAKPGL